MAPYTTVFFALVGMLQYATCLECQPYQFSAATCLNLCNLASHYIAHVPTPTTDAVCRKASQCGHAQLELTPLYTYADRICYTSSTGAIASRVVLNGTQINPANVTCSAILGDLTYDIEYTGANISIHSLIYISGSLDISTFGHLSLVDMQALQFVFGDVMLHVVVNAAVFGTNIGLTSISFPQLTYVGGSYIMDTSLAVLYNVATTLISAPLLKSVGHGMTIHNNIALAALQLQSLTFIGGDVTISDCTALTSLALPSLQTVTGGVVITYTLGASNSPNLTMISLPDLIFVGTSVVIYLLQFLSRVDMPRLTSVGGDVQLAYLTSLPVLLLYQLWSVSGNVYLANCDALTFINLISLTYVGTTVTIINNPSLTWLTAPVLSVVGSYGDTTSLSICQNSINLSLAANIEDAHAGGVCNTNQHSCSQTTTCRSITSVFRSGGSNIDVHLVQKYTSILGFLNYINSNITLLYLPRLTYISIDLFVLGNSLLTVIDMPQLSLVDASIVITTSTENNTAFTSLSLASLTWVSGGITLYSASKGSNYFTSLALLQLPRLQYTSGNVEIGFTTMLSVLELPALTYVGAYFYVKSNVAMTTVSAPALTMVSQLLYIEENAAMTTLNFPLLQTVGTLLHVGNLPSLTSFQFQHLTQLGGIIEVKLNAALTMCALPVLTYITQAAIFYDNTALTAILVPALIKIANHAVNGNTNGSALIVCGNSIALRYSSLIVAASGLPCKYPPNECLSTSYPLCDINKFIYKGDFSNVALEPFSAYIAVTGSFEYIGSDITSMSMPVLTYVGGSINVAVDMALTMVDFPALTWVSSVSINGYVGNSNNTALSIISLLSLSCINQSLTVYNSVSTAVNTALTLIELPKLTFVGNAINFHFNYALSVLLLPSLQYVGTDLVIDKNLGLTYVDLSALLFVGGRFTFTRSSLTSTVVLSSLVLSVGTILFAQGSGIASVILPNLQIAGNDVNLDVCSVVGVIDFPSLSYVANNFYINDSPALTYLSALTLTYIGGFFRITLSPLVNYLAMPNLILIAGSCSGTCSASNWTVEICGTDLSAISPTIPRAAGDGICLLQTVNNCTSAVFGNGVIASSTFFGSILNADVNIVQTYSIIVGNMAYEGTQLHVIDFPSLLSIAGSIKILDEARLTSISFDVLTYADSISIVGITGTAGISVLSAILLPQLRVVATNFAVTNNYFGNFHTYLSYILLPSLSYVGDEFLLDTAFPLTVLTLPRLLSTGTFAIDTNPSMWLISVPKLTYVSGSLIFNELFSLTKVDIPSVQSITGNIAICMNGNEVPLSSISNVLLAGQNYCAVEYFQSCSSHALCPVNAIMELASSDNHSLFPDSTSINGTLVFAHFLISPSITSTQLASIHGHLQVFPAANVSYIQLSSLVTVDGEIYIEGNCDYSIASELQLPRLSFVGANIFIGSFLCGQQASLIDFALLTTVMGHVRLTNNHQLTSVAMASLTYVGSYLHVDNNAYLTFVSLPALLRINGALRPGDTEMSLNVDSNGHLVAIDVSALQYIGGQGISPIFICNNSASFAPSSHLPALVADSTCVLTTTPPCMSGVLCLNPYTGAISNNVTASTFAMYSSIHGKLIFSQQFLTYLGAPVLTSVGSYVTVSNNAYLTLISLPLLTWIEGYLYVTDNAVLTYVSMPSLIAVQNVMVAATALQFCNNAAGLTVPSNIMNAASGKLCSLTIAQCMQNMPGVC